MEIMIMCGPFKAYPAARWALLVESDGSVLAWDPLAGHYTHVHSLGAGAIRRARALVRALESTP